MYSSPVSYWNPRYKLEIKPACCVVDWTAVSDQFPQGLEWLSNKLGKSMMLYTDTFCNDTIYRRSDGGNWTFMDADPVHISWFDGYVANVAPEESYSFYTALMQRGKQQGMGYEHSSLPLTWHCIQAQNSTSISCRH
jgi:hypothetical protein